jgi:hypothetical protein
MTTESLPKRIGAMIDELEKIREDLFHLQSEMEELESAQERPSGGENKNS